MKQLWEIINRCWINSNNYLSSLMKGKNIPRKGYIQEILIIIAFLSITLSLMIIDFSGSAKGYEISIYQAYPVYLWFLVILNLFCGISIVVYQSFQKKPSNIWVTALIALVWMNAIIIILPFFRDYFIMGRGDVLSHIGFAKEILGSGYFEASGIFGENLYPLLHIFMVEFYYFTGIGLNLQTQILPLIYYLFFILSLYLLGREITKSSAKTILILAFGSILFLQFETSMLSPSIEGFYLLPFLIYLFYKTRSSMGKVIEYDLIFVLYLIFVPFFHPGELTLFLILILALIYVSARLYSLIQERAANNRLKLSLNRDSSSIFLLLIVVWLIWFTSFSSFLVRAKMVLDWFLKEVGTTNMDLYFSILGTANLSISNFISLALNLYGQYILFFILALVISIFVLKGIIFHKDEDDLKKLDLNIFTYVIIFLFFAGFVLLSFVGLIGVEFNRVLKYEMLIAIILIGMYLYSHFQNRQNMKRWGLIFIISFLMITGVIGLFNAYPSPLTKTANYQTTDMELTGQNWFINYRDPSLIIDDNINYYYGQILRFNDAIKGVKFNMNNKSIIYTGPDHFNYKNKTFYGETYDSNWYYIDMTLLRIAYPELYPGYENKWRYTPADYLKFDKTDKTVYNIYNNGDFRVFYIRGV